MSRHRPFVREYHIFPLGRAQGTENSARLCVALLCVAVSARVYHKINRGK